MKKRMNTGLICLSLALMLTPGALCAETGRFPWLTDLDEARELAATKDMPLLIVFRCEP